MTVAPTIIRDRLRIIAQRFFELAELSKQNGGRLSRHDIWRKSYLAFPYLVGAPDDRVAQRFRDVFINQAELNDNAKIGLLPGDLIDGFMAKFAHLLEEYGARGGGIPSNIITDARQPLLRYFENGQPIAVKIFNGYARPASRFIVKYGQRKFLEPMLHTGHLRICPATYYNDTAHNDAVKDDEIHRTFYIPTFQERLRGIHHVTFQGHRVEFGDDDIVLPVVAPDYFLFSLCDDIYYRMPTDFDSDAALIICNPDLFAQRLISAFLARWPDWGAEYGPVIYYDPYRDFDKVRVHEMSKHFGYAYQREVRIVLRARRRPRANLEPEFLDIGSMTDYADLVHA
jgi:hypothetical protein